MQIYGTATRREEMVSMISDQPMALQEIASMLHADIKDVVEDIQHLRYAVRPKKIHVEPAACRACSFVFRDRRRGKTPTKCPCCKGERINPNKYLIK
ncbi:MAG: hypothetical protein ABIC95_03640 [archaeon]